MPININEAQLYDDYNKQSSFELCHHGQELVQELVNKVAETIQILRHLSLYIIHGDQNSYFQRKLKLEELFSSFEFTLKRLRLISFLLTNRKSELDLNYQPESNQTTVIDELNKEKIDLQEKIKEKNSYLKLSIDQITDIIWNINSIQSIKQS